MNEYGVLTTKDEIESLVGMDYKTPDKEGLYVAKLIHRHWYNNGKRRTYALVCDFITTDGRKSAFFAFRRQRKKPSYKEFYTHSGGEIDFETEVKEGTWWELTVSRASTGNLKWESAVQVTDPVSLEIYEGYLAKNLK